MFSIHPSFLELPSIPSPPRLLPLSTHFVPTQTLHTKYHCSVFCCLASASILLPRLASKISASAFLPRPRLFCLGLGFSASASTFLPRPRLFCLGLDFSASCTSLLACRSPNFQWVELICYLCTFLLGVFRATGDRSVCVVWAVLCKVAFLHAHI